LPKQKKRNKPTASSGRDLRARVERARQEGRFQQALELVKQFHKNEPTPENLELLKTCYLGRARQLRGQGYNRDALTVLEVALRLDETTPAWLEQIASELALSGGTRQALALLEKIPGAETAGRILGQVVDGAIQQEAAGRELLPEALRPDFDRVIQAFKQAEAGQDWAVRETLQPIGLRSPFLQWKVLLRGFEAYYQRDDERALENWQRLDAARLPARLAAPFRFAIDRDYRTAQSAATQAALQKQFERTTSSLLSQQLRSLRASLEHKENLAPAFRHAETLLPVLRQEAPHLVPRLAACFYWAAVETGPEDSQRYRRVFGAPPDDPHFHRLEALAYDRAPHFTNAHKSWQLFEKEIAAHSEVWPGEQANRARALVWLHMGRNAALIPGDKKIAKLPRYLRDDPDRPRPLKPSAEECFEHGIELAPDLVEAYEALFRYHLDEGEEGKAVKAAKHLLARFPDHAATLQELGELQVKRNAFVEGLDFLRRALQHNPLDRKLRGKVGTAHMWNARHYAEAGRFVEARQNYQAALTFHDEPALVYCRWAACEFKAGDVARAEELLTKARETGESPLAISYVLLTECARMKLDKKLKPRFDKEFAAGLAEPATPASAADLASIAASLESAGITYHGQKTHVKKILAFVQKTAVADFPEAQMEEICRALVSLGSNRAATQFLHRGQKLFPRNPHFQHLEAVLLMVKGPDRMYGWQLQQLLENAEKLARDLPPSEAKDELLKDIERRLKAVQALNPFGFSFSRMFADFDDDGFDEEFDETDEGSW
jgi:tetratricopeptide (TPR) repeat protein